MHYLNCMQYRLWCWDVGQMSPKYLGSMKIESAVVYRGIYFKIGHKHQPSPSFTQKTTPSITAAAKLFI